MAWLDRHAIDLVGLALVLYAAIPANSIWHLFVEVPWQKTRLGKVLFGKAMMIALVLDLSLVATVLRLLELGRPVWFEVLRLVMFLGVGTALWAQRKVFRELIPAPRHKEPHQ